MARTVSPFKLGLFIIICGTLGLITVIWLGASHIFEKYKTYVSFFDESVKGLQKDATVNYRGVGVGRVAEIRLAPDGRLIEVVMNLRPDFHVDKSLAIQLRPQGITGLSYLEIDTAPPDIETLTPKLDFPVEYPVIPSYPSEIQQLKSALETLYAKINAMDLESLTKNWTQTAQLVNGILVQLQKAIEPQEWRDTVTAVRKTAEDAASFMNRLAAATSQKDLNQGFNNLYATLRSTREAANSLAAQLKGLPPNALAEINRNLSKTVTAGTGLLSSADRQIGDSAALLQQSLQQLNVLLTQMTSLVQNLKEEPNRLLFPSHAPNPFKRK